MFDQLDPKVRRVLTTSRELAEGGAIDSGHLLVGILLVEEHAVSVVAQCGIDPNRLADMDRPQPFDTKAGPISADARRSISEALASAASNGRDLVTVADLLVGISGALFDPKTGQLQEWNPVYVMLNTLGADVKALAAAAREWAQNQDANEHDGFVTDGEEDNEDESGRPPWARRKKSKKSALAAFGTDMVAQARLGRYDTVIGRDEEINNLIITLGRKTKRNPVLVGPAGSGKTAIMEGLAQRIADGNVPDDLKDVDMWSIDVGQMLAGTRFRGDFEERIKQLLSEATEKNVILCIDEVHTIMGAGAGAKSDGPNMDDMLKPALARGELRLVGATTLDEYRIIEKDSAVERRLNPVEVKPFGVVDTVKVLRSLAPKLEEHHKSPIDDDALVAAATMGSRYVVDRQLPDSAIDILDEAGARITVQRGLGREVPETLNRALVAEVVSAMTGIDVTNLDENRHDKLVNLETTLNQTIIGQTEAINEVARAAQRTGAGLRDINRPVVSFLFCGPTGVGKTMLAGELAEAFFGDRDAISTFDMSEFSEKHTVSALLGSPPGYIGFDEGGRLVEAIRRRRAQVLLFDEVEKAHPHVFDALLSLLDEGHVTGSDGRKADATECVIVMTSNLGTRDLSRAQVGFGTSSDGQTGAAHRHRAVESALRDYFRPEFLNRIDSTVVFSPLGVDELTAIARLELSKLDGRMATNGNGLIVGSGVAELVASTASVEHGARGIRRAVADMVENPVVDLLLSGATGNLVVEVSDDSIKVSQLVIDDTNLPAGGPSTVST